MEICIYIYIYICIIYIYICIYILYSLSTRGCVFGLKTQNITLLREILTISINPSARHQVVDTEIQALSPWTLNAPGVFVQGLRVCDAHGQAFQHQMEFNESSRFWFFNESKSLAFCSTQFMQNGLVSCLGTVRP